MKDFESWLLTYLLNSLWQIPLLFAAGWLAARALRPAGAAAEHRMWVVSCCCNVCFRLVPPCRRTGCKRSSHGLAMPATLAKRMYP